ncbi:hypothetical protein [Desulfosporosinus youngiae]|uniref:hypothetical protein n=1 Tax=Desulfosporosinus youngiae TaxID=339862 RepID=UPI0005A7327D|nr:hypothetical protein [Desulfosporosinus youngiae]
MEYSTHRIHQILRSSSSISIIFITMDMLIMAGFQISLMEIPAHVIPEAAMAAGADATKIISPI